MASSQLNQIKINPQLISLSNGVFMSSVTANGIDIEYEVFGDSSAPPLLLVMGLGAQMIHWDDEFCQQLADSGFHVIRYDNRDVGLSTKMTDAKTPNPGQLMADLQEGRQPEVDYTLDDMAADGISLLDALGIEQAHVCGASMGGMIVQVMAINHGDRIKSMTSIMSTTGNPELSPATPEAMGALMAAPAADREAQIEQSISSQRIIGSTGFPFDEDRARRRSALAYDRSFYPVGTARQMAAVVVGGSRKEALQKIDIPALVVHGVADPLVPLDGGIDTHAAIKGSRLLTIEGMGHDMPPGSWNQIVEAISELAQDIPA
jgi:pimeloyl-ACP methyl ester carboxylesterase